jgi:helix-turn-helix, Psq domain
MILEVRRIGRGMRPLSGDLRKRVVSGVCEEGMSCRAAARRFGVSFSTLPPRLAGTVCSRVAVHSRRCNLSIRIFDSVKAGTFSDDVGLHIIRELSALMWSRPCSNSLLPIPPPRRTDGGKVISPKNTSRCGPR